MMKVGYINFWTTGDFIENHLIKTFIQPLNESGLEIEEKMYNPIIEKCDLVIHSVFGNVANLSRVIGNPTFVCYSGEARLDGYVAPNGYSLSFKRDSEHNLYYPIWQECYANLRYRRPVNTHKTKFCTYIVSNGAFWWRNLVFEGICTHYKKIDSCGTAMNNMDNHFVLPRDMDKAVEFHNDYKFNLCFENGRPKDFGESFYITEKLVNAYVYGTVPIYWGCEEVDKWFNPKSFVDCNGKTVEDIIKEVKHLDKDDNAYYAMLNEPLFRDDVDWSAYARNRYVEFMKKILLSK